MSCFHPRPARRYIVDGQPVVKMISEAEAMCDTRGDVFPVRCGRCIGCRLDDAREKSLRCVLEASCWSFNWFVTLTYDPDHLPLAVSDQTGEIAGTLSRQDLVNFRKRLCEEFRQRGHVGIRQMSAGEYGGRGRPHYHLLLFNCPLDDLKLWSRSPLGDSYFRSATIERCWPFGQSLVGEVTPQSASYVARYCQKKAGSPAPDPPRAPEFLTSSNKPGIGAPWLDRHDISGDLIYLPGGQISRPPRYFDKIREARGEDLTAVKAERKRLADLYTAQHIQMVTSDYHQELEDLEAIMQRKARLLTRPAF